MFDCLALILWQFIASISLFEQRGIKSIFSVPAHCQYLNILNGKNSIDLLFNTLHVSSLFKVCELVYTDLLPWRLPTRLLVALADATDFELVGFCFSQTECFNLQILSQQ